MLVRLKRGRIGIIKNKEVIKLLGIQTLKGCIVSYEDNLIFYCIFAYTFCTTIHFTYIPI